MFCSGATPRRALKSATATQRSREGEIRRVRTGCSGFGASLSFWLRLGAMSSSVDLPASSAWALERLAARRAFPSEARTGACRSLFGPVDHEQLRREFRGQLRQIREESQRRWEFDFAAGAPLPPGHQARFQWEEVDAAALPAFYRETLLPGAARRLLRRKSKAPAEGEEEEQEREEPATQPESDAPPLGALSHEGAESGCYSGILLKPLPGSAKRTRIAHITDFFAKRKRVAADSSSALALEQTPRKRLR
ncbi:cyclin-dependent kinase inhibitor 1C [Anolis carolinensis]|uniref:cyclin-dependent kinase inhibitor 1C n=1 Tax=Anolis carolinensis TaxID=28377 RepID=UPI002F2B2BF4